MLPTINGKSFLDCTESDLQVLIDNPDYRENDYIDYKASFAFLEIEKNDPHRTDLLAEFRSDVCQFANAEGGYLIYGIKDKRGMANEIVGVNIPGNNTDRFELERKNNLVPIMPKLPSIKFKFIPLESGKYVVVIAVIRDSYVPYLHLESEADYRIYKRVGNGKRILSYMELKNMFIQSRSLEQDIINYRVSRLNYFRDCNDSIAGSNLCFMLLHIIPETFTDSSYNKDVFLLERRGKLKFSPMFSSMGCSSRSIPNVDGLRFVHPSDVTECFATNNGIVECFLPISKNYIHTNPQGNIECLDYDSLWNAIEQVVEYYMTTLLPEADASRIFASISLVGCKGLVTDLKSCRHFEDNSTIDRNELLCTPVVFYKEDTPEDALMRLRITYLLSIGIRHSEELQEYVKNADC